MEGGKRGRLRGEFDETVGADEAGEVARRVDRIGFGEEPAVGLRAQADREKTGQSRVRLN